MTFEEASRSEPRAEVDFCIASEDPAPSLLPPAAPAPTPLVASAIGYPTPTRKPYGSNVSFDYRTPYGATFSEVQ